MTALFHLCLHGLGGAISLLIYLQYHLRDHIIHHTLGDPS